MIYFIIMFQKLLKNKKGIGFIGSLLNVVSDTFGHLRELIGQMLAKAPRIIYPIIFLFFILIIGGLMNFFLQMSGFHCDINKNTARVDIINVPGNWDLYQKKPNEDNINSSEIDIETGIFGIEQKCVLKYGEATIKFQNGSKLEFNETRYFYRGVYCDQCEETISVCPAWEGCEDLCLGDVYRNENITGRHFLFWSKKNECNKQGNYFCMPPDNYFYNSSVNQYQAVIISESNTLGRRYDQLLYEDYEALPFSFYNETRIVDIRCDNNYNTRLTFFTIDIFNFTLWIFLFIFGALAWFFIKFIIKK